MNRPRGNTVSRRICVEVVGLCKARLSSDGPAKDSGWHLPSSGLIEVFGVFMSTVGSRSRFWLSVRCACVRVVLSLCLCASCLPCAFFAFAVFGVFVLAL